MYNNHHGGYLKALIDLENIIEKYDLWCYQTYNKENHTGKKMTFTTKANFPKLLTFFIHHVPELITWGDFVEFKAMVGGKLEMISQPDLHNISHDYIEGYTDALKELHEYFSTCDCKVTRKSILLTIKEYMEGV